MPFDLKKIDHERFAQACQSVKEQLPQGGIGRLKEKNLHAVFKYYVQQDPQYHEIKIGRYVADVFSEGKITEIQTGHLFPLGKKLAFYLASYPVTVVHPILHRKYLTWVDDNTGEMSQKRRSPKTGTWADCFGALYSIRQFISHQNFRLCLILYDGEELRSLNGWSMDKKRGSTRIERIATSLVEQRYLQTPWDYQQLLPDTLDPWFTSNQLIKSVTISRRVAWFGLTLLCELGALERVGKQGNCILYQKTSLHPSYKKR